MNRSFAAALAALALCAPALAQDTKAARAGGEEKPGLPAWIVTCSNANPGGAFLCKAEQTLTMASSGQRIVAIAFQRDAADKNALKALLQLPHGIRLADGIEFWVDDSEHQKAPIQHADQNGSYSVITVAPALEKALRNGTTLKVLTKPLAGNDLIVELTLDGFSAAADHLK
ncbi:MAG: invasion associated locus B family protein [Phyllobacteriaceae bacterium]|nr:invasion associated locus B family protein [Phyllobacteriaceae bacterium]